VPTCPLILLPEFDVFDFSASWAGYDFGEDDDEEEEAEGEEGGEGEEEEAVEGEEGGGEGAGKGVDTGADTGAGAGADTGAGAGASVDEKRKTKQKQQKPPAFTVLGSGEMLLTDGSKSTRLLGIRQFGRFYKQVGWACGWVDGSCGWRLGCVWQLVRLCHTNNHERWSASTAGPSGASHPLPSTP
jgi:hypothetical protein